MRLEVLWEPWHCQGMEHLRLSVDRDGVFAESQVRDHQAGFDIRYVVRADADWRTRGVEVARLDSHHSLRLSTDGEGRWEGHPELEGCRDVDLRCTPFTNSLPIHRQPEGGPVRAVWIGLELEIEPLEQHYTPLGERRWHYRAGDFERELEVDEHGLVLDYPDGWRRVRERL